MMGRIERGEADCLVAWAPDRLARNSIDGGHIIYLLDRGVLRDLKFATYTFENNSQGKFMLSIMFGQSKYYSDALSDNVKRGNRTKAAKGWRPGSVPFGYLNNVANKTVEIDPTYFPLARRMFDLVLAGGHSARQIARIAREDWGARSPKRRKGGSTIHHSMVHRLLTNPFYAGYFEWEGQMVEGAHEPVVTLDEFNRVQETIRRRDRPRPVRHAYPFAGLMRCGECGCAVTAQTVTNRYGVSYTYYRCTRRRLDVECRQPSIRADEFERQMIAWLGGLPSGSEVERRIREILEGFARRAGAASSAIRETVEHALRETRTQITELTGLRIRQLIDDAEFTDRRAALQSEAARLTRKLDELARPEEALKPTQELFSFSNYAADWFRAADDGLKRQIVKAACLNLVLVNKEVSIEAAKWLSALVRLLACPIRLGSGGDVETVQAEFDAALGRLSDELGSDERARAQAQLAIGVVTSVAEKRREAA